MTTKRKRKNKRKNIFFGNAEMLRSRHPTSHGQDEESHTPIKRPTTVSYGSSSLVIFSDRKPYNYDQSSLQKQLELIQNLKTRYLPAKEEMNSAFLTSKLTQNEIDTLKDTVIPESIKSQQYTTDTVTINLSNKGIKRTSAKTARKSIAKEDFQTVIPVINECDDLEVFQKEAFSKFFKLYDKNNDDKEKIPCAEWCHMIALSLSSNQKEAMSADNLFAATAMTNTKMINLEKTARNLYKAYKDKYTINIQTQYTTFKGTKTIAELSQYLIVTDREGREYKFEQKINPFEINKISQTNSVRDPDHAYNFILKKLSELNNSNELEPKRLKLDDEALNTIKKTLKF